MTLQIPTQPGVIFVYDIDEGSVQVSKTRTGWYGETGRFDFEAKTEKELREKLAGWGATFAGIEHE
jgi:hypothetical protein